MRLAASRIITFNIVLLSLWLTVAAQDVSRDLAAGTGSTIEVVNKYGRVSVKAVPETGGMPIQAKLTATSPKGVIDREIKVSSSLGRTLITIAASDPRKRIDIILTLPERAIVKIDTTAGAIDVAGDFASVEARSETGTISADVPPDDVAYYFQWTESRPRVLAAFDLTPMKEKAAGRFEIRGHHLDAGKGKSSKRKGKVEDPPEDPPAKPEVAKPRTVALNLTTARGIILLNVPPNEVMSDLRERPLTEAAKAIVRSGDSLLMEAIRRASPKYFSDYTRTLPPASMEPKFSPRSSQVEVPHGRVKTALVRATDLKNRAIDGLEAKDFEVVENGMAREITAVKRSTAPFNLVLLLDVSGSVENYVNFIRKTARNFVETVGQNDRVSIVIFNEDVKMLSKFTTDKGKLSQSLDTFDAGGGTAFYDALAFTVADTLRPLRGERTAIVILTDGDDNRSFLPFDSLMGSIQESGALIYPLYVPSGLIALAATGSDIDPLRTKYMSLSAKSEGEGERLAKISGGVYYSINQIGQIQKAYEDIIVQLRSAYEITYRSDASTASSAGASPRLKVRVKRENVFTAIMSVVAVGEK